MAKAEVFNPVDFSLEECQFLAKYLGEAPEVVEIDTEGGFPVGVNPNAVMPALERIYRLTQQAEKRGFQWCGVPAVKGACVQYVTEMKKWQADARRGGPKFPSQYVWDESGRGHKGAVGADAGVVQTYFDASGNRKPFAVELIPSGFEGYKPSWLQAERPTRLIPRLIDDKEKHLIQCPVCFFTQTYDKDTRSTYNNARMRMARHLTASRRDADAHHEVYTQEFQAGEVK